MMEAQNTLNSGMCRCCSSEGTFKDIKTTYRWMGEEEVYAEMLTDCFDIKIQTPEDMDNGICELCITQLRNALNFKKQVLHTEEQFKRRMQGRDVKNPIKIESVEDSIESDHLSDQDFTEEYEVPIKVEIEEKPKAKKRPAKPATPRAKKAKSEPESSQREETQFGLKLKRSSKKEDSENKRSRTNQESTTAQNEDNKVKTKGPTELEMHRNNIRIILESSNATPIRAHGGIGYQCSFCPEQYPNPADLKTHTIQGHDSKTKRAFMRGKAMAEYFVKLDITALRCELCNSNVDSLDLFTSHLIDKHGKKMYTDIDSHILPFKFDEETLRCVFCPNDFNTFKVLQEHMNVHFRNYICEICDSGFVARNMRRNHQKTHETGSFICSFCPKVYDTALKQRGHEKQVHRLPKLNLCAYCNERFRDFRQKVKHLKEVHGIQRESPKCKACERTFETMAALRLHIKRDHLIQRPHKCSECDMSFYAKAQLKNHFVIHSGTREFSCAVCFKSFGRKKTLADHMRIHTDDRRYKCKHCEMAFVQKSSLRGHMRSNHSELNLN
ncbi:zinc finger protein 93-like isoform X7 [Leguminivora glycinivorella]|uniref:zinc finger protein 93-like isoform X7 n=1 Tax=Leguminivora glycinivorella TaxID=1035111 RepID=UPI00200EF45D|nr:zinc finger protein 93-like isoform X7 [Leguminivora glycinivorella]